jgi:hypothetical protein
MLQLDTEERVGRLKREAEMREHAEEDLAYAATVQAARRAMR